MQERIDIEKAKKGIVIALLLGITAVGAIIAFTFDTRTIDALLKIDATFLWLAIAAIVASWLFSALAFTILTNVIKKPLGLAASGRVYLGGSFFGFITPFGSGLIPAQIYILTREGLSPGQATAITGSRATISSWLFVALGLIIFIVFRSSLPEAAKAGLLGIAIAATIWSLVTLFFIKEPEKAKNIIEKIFSNRFITNRISEIHLTSAKGKLNKEIEFLSSNLKDLFSLRNAPAILAVFMIEILAWFALFAVLPLVMIGFGVEGNLSQLIFRIFLLFSVAPFSPTPGGSGVVEAAFAGLLFDLVPRSLIGLIVIVWRFLTYYLTLIAGGLVAARIMTKPALKGRQ